MGARQTIVHIFIVHYNYVTNRATPFYTYRPSSLTGFTGYLASSVAASSCFLHRFSVARYPLHMVQNEFCHDLLFIEKQIIRAALRECGRLPHKIDAARELCNFESELEAQIPRAHTEHAVGSRIQGGAGVRTIGRLQWRQHNRVEGNIEFGREGNRMN